MNRNIFLILCLCFLFIGCIEHNDSIREKNKSFPIEKRVELENVKVKPVLLFISDMVILDGKLITLDMKNDVFFQLFNLPDFRYIGPQIYKGEGPLEEVLIFPYIETVRKDAFAYRTMDKIKIVSYDVIKNRYTLLESYRIPQETGILNFCLLNNGLCGYNMLGRTEQEFIRYDFRSHKIQNFGPSFPSVGFSINDDKRNMLFTKVMVSKGDGSRFAALYDKFPLLRIYDKDGDLLSETEYINHQIQPVGYNNKEMETSDMENTTIDYMRIKATDKYIYGLYSGMTNKQLAVSGTDKSTCCCEIHVWDWSGSPVARFMLNKNVTCFAVSQDDSYIILSSCLYEDTLYKMRIPDLVTR